MKLKSILTIFCELFSLETGNCLEHLVVLPLDFELIKYKKCNLK